MLRRNDIGSAPPWQHAESKDIGCRGSLSAVQIWKSETLT